MKTIIPDASVVVKWYIPEQDHEKAKALRDRYINDQIKLSAPDLLPYEVVNALHYSGCFDTEELKEAGTSLMYFGIEFISFSKLGPVSAMARQLDVTIYDAAYLAHSSSRNQRLYTSDETLLEAVRKAEANLDPEPLHIRDFQ